MVERDVGNHAYQRFDNIGRIQPAAHANFENRSLHPLPREVGEGDRRHHLKEAGMPGQISLPD